MSEHEITIQELAKILEPWLDSVSGSFPRDQPWQPQARRKGRVGL